MNKIYILIGMMLALSIITTNAKALEAFKLNTTDDAMINQASPTTNYGTGDSFSIGQSLSALAKFDISNSSFPAYSFNQNAILWIYQYLFAGGGGEFNVTIFGTQNQTWKEYTVTWNIAENTILTPGNNATYLSINNSMVSTYVGWIGFNVTNWFNWMKSQGYSNITFYINYSRTTPENGHYNFYTKEHASYYYLAPSLNITYDKPYVLYNNSDAVGLETKNNIYNISIVDWNESNQEIASIFINGTYRGYTNLIHSGIYWNYSFVGIPELLQGETNETTYNVTWQFISFGYSQNITFPIKITRLRILPCSVPMNNQTVNFSVFDTISQTSPIISNFSGLFYAWIDSGSRNYSYSLSNAFNYTLCIFPEYASYKMNATIIYTNTSYASGSYAIQNKNFSNVSQNINLYLLNTANSTSVLFTVYDSIKVPKPNVLIIAQKLNPATATYTSVANGQTGYDGTVSIGLQLGQYYQFTIQINGATLAVIPAFQLNTNSQSLYITSNFIAMFNYIDSVGGSCTTSNTTYHLTCTYSDLSGLMSYISLKVTTMSILNTSITLCSLNSTASSGNFDCDLSAYNQSVMYYNMQGTFSTDPVSYTVLTSGNINWAGSHPLLNLGLLGILIALIMEITLFFGGMTNSPSTGMILACIGLIAEQVVGLLDIGWFSLIPILLTAVVIIYKLED